MPAPIIECPPELGPLARQEWDRVVGHLAATGVLSHFDRGPLAIYCAAYGHWIEATEAMQKYGTMMKSPSGYPVQSPYVAIANRQAEIMMRIASEFGFTPASRGRLWMVSNISSGLLDLEDIDDGNRNGDISQPAIRFTYASGRIAALLITSDGPHRW